MKYLYKLIKVVYSTLTLLGNFLKYTFKWHISVFGQTLLTIEGKVLVVWDQTALSFFSNASKKYGRLKLVIRKQKKVSVHFIRLYDLIVRIILYFVKL